MALPKLNDTPKYSIVVPSTNKKVRFRPYLVKEEKVLLMAVETGDQKNIIEAVVDTIASCVYDKLNTEDLTTFDVEFLFTQIRSKSSGETVPLLLKCSECEVPNETSVRLDELKIKVPKKKSVVELNDQVSMELRYPPYSILTDFDFEDESSEATRTFKLAGRCIKAVFYDDERIANEDITEDEM